MTERFCKKCNHLCHCIEADHSDCKCENCECNGREEDRSFENEGGFFNKEEQSLLVTIRISIL